MSCVGRWEMSNFDRAVKALDDVDEAIDRLADNEAYVTALEAAGLLMPDLPRPTRDRLWQTSALELGIKTVHYAADQVVVHTSGGRLHTHYKQARDLAMALLAAADYAEKEQGNG